MVEWSVSAKGPHLVLSEESQSEKPVTPTTAQSKPKQQAKYHDVRAKSDAKPKEDEETRSRGCTLWAKAGTASTSPLSPSSSTTTSTAIIVASEALTEQGLDISKAVYPQYKDLQIRLDSYEGWRWSNLQDPRVLAEAGLYFTGQQGFRDCVRCFYCGVGLMKWEEEDEPWVEHARWRSYCSYVTFMKGEQFVVTALERLKDRNATASLIHHKIHTKENTLLTNGPTEGKVVLDPKTKSINVDFVTECLNTMKHSQKFWTLFDITSQAKYDKTCIDKHRYDVMDKTYNLAGIHMYQSLVVCPFTSLRSYFEDIKTGTPTIPKEHYEGFRLTSFNATNVSPSAIGLAKHGFYATGDGDEVKCFSCGIANRNWQLTDDPLTVHQMLSPNCMHITSGDRRNVPIDQVEADVTTEDGQPPGNPTPAAGRYLTEDGSPGSHQDTNLSQFNHFVQQDSEPSFSFVVQNFNHQHDYCLRELKQMRPINEIGRERSQPRIEPLPSASNLFTAGQMSIREQETRRPGGIRLNRQDGPVPEPASLQRDGADIPRASGTYPSCKLCGSREPDNLICHCGLMVICKKCSKTCILRRCPYC